MKIIERIKNLFRNEGKITDGYHTFDELYEYRTVYNAAYFNELYKHSSVDVFKSLKHSDGEYCFGGAWFIVVAELPTGQISNHYEMKYWDLFDIPEKAISNKYDGHTPKDVLNRLKYYLNLSKDNKNLN